VDECELGKSALKNCRGPVFARVWTDQCQCAGCGKSEDFALMSRKFRRVSYAPETKSRAARQDASYPLLDHINPHHPLVELAAMIDWTAIDRVASEPFVPKPGPIRPRLIAGLLYLQHALIIARKARVTPRFWPDFQICTPAISPPIATVDKDLLRFHLKQTAASKRPVTRSMEDATTQAY
jgi:hypothetical protein